MNGREINYTASRISEAKGANKAVKEAFLWS